MDDKIIMDTALSLTKGMCDLLMHGSIESQEPKLNKMFIDSLMKYLELQQEMYMEMQNQGLYNAETVTESKISKVVKKHPSDMIA